MSKLTLERQNRRLIILKGLSQDLTYSEIASQLGVNRWVIMTDLKLMRKNGDPEYKTAKKVQEKIRAKKRETLDKDKIHIKYNERFLRMTGMTIQEKTFINMIEFYRPELIEIINSKDQHTAIMKLPKSVRNTLNNNGIITQGWHEVEVSSEACNYLLSNENREKSE
jgi:transcriptional antiterminator